LISDNQRPAPIERGAWNTDSPNSHNAWYTASLTAASLLEYEMNTS
jgi:hypothetical protein